MGIYGASGTVEIEELGAVPTEPIYGADNRHDKLAAIVVDLNDDLQDEIGERRVQFETLINMNSEIEERFTKSLVDMDSRIEERLAVMRAAITASFLIGGVILCLILGVMILNM